MGDEFPYTQPVRNVDPIAIDGAIEVQDLVVSLEGLIVASRYDRQVELGNLYCVSWAWEWTEDDASYRLFIRCGEADCHIAVDFNLPVNFNVGLHEDPTPTVWGTQLSAHPMNRTVLDNPALTRFFHTPTPPVTSGTRLMSMRSEASLVNIGHPSIGHWVLARRKDYLITITNESAATGAAGFIATFYEQS